MRKINFTVTAANSSSCSNGSHCCYPNGKIATRWNNFVTKNIKTAKFSKWFFFCFVFGRIKAMRAEIHVAKSQWKEVRASKRFSQHNRVKMSQYRLHESLPRFLKYLSSWWAAEAKSDGKQLHNGTITIKFQIGTHIGKIEIIKLGIVFRFFLINVEIHRNFIETMCCYWISTVEQPNECVCVNVNGIWNWVHTKVIIDREPVECAGNSIPSNSANANAL